MEQQEFGANNEPCLSVDPAAEVREAHGAGSLPNEPVVSIQRSLVCSILLLSRPILPQQLQPTFVGVFPYPALELQSTLSKATKQRLPEIDQL
jgi:hypothetical protein